MKTRTKTLVFDICGVLYDVSGGVERMLEWLNRCIDERELMRRWVIAEPVRRIELGKIGMEEFARGVIADFRIPVGVDTFIKDYNCWHKGPYEGAIELIRDLSKKCVTASLSNISEFQWEKIRKSGIIRYMKFNFVSFEIGYVKPDREAFDYVMKILNCNPTEIYFFDDNKVNIDAAVGMGIRGYRTRGLGELRDTLSKLGILR